MALNILNTSHANSETENESSSDLKIKTLTKKMPRTKMIKTREKALVLLELLLRVFHSR